jgi:uncharacterized protein YndB with AHSA1/START domain
MIKNPVVHGTFAIERNYKASPERVFAAFASQETKRRWFVEGKGFQIDQFTSEFRVGGRERSRFRFKGGPVGAPTAGTAIGNDTTYMDIVPDDRIVFAYTMTIGEKRISASLVTVQLVKVGDETSLMFTEQGAFFEGADGAQRREEGWRALLQRLDEELRSV